MFRTNKLTRTGRVVAAGALGLALLLGAGRAPVSAANGTTNYLTCAAGSFSINLGGSTAISAFRIRVDNAQVFDSAYYRTLPGQIDQWTGARWVIWASYPRAELAYPSKGSQLVEAWEYRSVNGGRTYSWVGLGSCHTRDLYGNFDIVLGG